MLCPAYARGQCTRLIEVRQMRSAPSSVAWRGEEIGVRDIRRSGRRTRFDVMELRLQKLMLKKLDEWRRGRDSNPRYGSRTPHSRRCIRTLCHSPSLDPEPERHLLESWPPSRRSRWSSRAQSARVNIIDRTHLRDAGFGSARMPIDSGQRSKAPGRRTNCNRLHRAIRRQHIIGRACGSRPALRQMPIRRPWQLEFE